VSNLGYYVGLLEDHRRIGAFARAIQAVVGPEDHVLEIGCGVGTYSLLAARAGARRVTAVDQDAVAIALAREIGVERLSKGRITLVEAPIEAVTLDEPADVVLFEDFGSIVFRQGLRALMERVRMHLAKPGARWIPAGAEILLAPIDLVYRTLSRHDLGPLPFPGEAVALLRKRGLNDVTAKEFDPEHVIAPGASCGRLGFGEPYPPRSRLTGLTTASRNGSVTALAGWMRLRLAPGILLDNSPAEKRQSWHLGVFPFEEPLEVREGDSLRMDMEVVHGPGSDGLLFRWGIEGPAGGRESSSVNAMPGDPASLRRGSPESVPQLARTMPAVLRALQAVGDGRPVAEIAKSVYDSHRDLFPEVRAAEDFLLVIFERLKGTAIQ
jgi:SAM-dependent methyltransferase